MKIDEYFGIMGGGIKPILPSTYILLAFLAFFISPQTSSAETYGEATSLSIDPMRIVQRLTLSSSEQTWLAKNPIIRSRVGAFPPFHSWFEGEGQGISVDFVRLFCQGFGLQCVFFTGMPWDGAIENIGAGKDGDLILTVKHTPERERYIAFTQDFLQLPWVIFTRDDSPFISGIVDLKGKTVSVERGFVMGDLLKKWFPDVRLHTVETSRDAVEALSTGQVDAYVGNLTVGTYLINRWAFSNVKVASPTRFGRHDNAMGVRKDWPELVSLLNRFHTAMTTQEHSQIKNRWLSVRYEYGVDWPFVWKLIGAILIISTIVVIVIVLWNRRLQREIIQRQKAETALRESEARLLQILDNSPYCVSIVSLANKRRLYVNRRFTEMFGVRSVEAAIEQDVAVSYVNSTDLENNWAAFERDGVIDAVEQQRKRPDGTVWWAFCNWRPLTFANEKTVMVWHYDATERKSAEIKIKKQRDELQKLNAQKDKFFSIIAHDLKGPFNALLGYSSLLSSGGASFDRDKVVEYSGAVHESAEQVFKLLENLLEWALLQMGRLEYQPGPVDLKEIINSNLELFAPVAGEKAIRLAGMREKSLNVFADAHMIDTVVRNLVNNAIKFTPENGHVTINARRDGKWAEVEVSDSGVGMSADKAARLFQLDEKTSTVGTGGETGTGLGLQLCKELVEKQGGRIHVTSAEGKGSVFHIKLPLYKPHANV